MGRRIRAVALVAALSVSGCSELPRSFSLVSLEEVRPLVARGEVEVVEVESLPGAGSAPGRGIASVGVSFDGDHSVALRRCEVPVIARVESGRTVIDLRSVAPADDELVTAAILSALR